MILNPLIRLKLDYPDYYWALDKENSATTGGVSNAMPIEMEDETLFPLADIEKAIALAGVEGETDYGGCGPIAEMGILDYFV